MRHLLEKLRNVGSMKGLVIAKFVVIGLLFLALDKGLHIGDKLSKAEEKGQEEPKAKESDAKEKGNNDAKKEGKEAASEPTPKRKSFLDDLLNLPALDPDKLKRDEVGHYLALIEKKKSQVNERMELLKKREDQLINLEKSIDDKLQRLDEERLFFAQTIQQEKDLQGQRLDKLIELFAKMEPKKASPVFEKLDKDLVVAMFKKLPQKQVTSILEGMNPQRSVELSEYFGRVRSAREYDLLREMNQSLKKEFNECKGMSSVSNTEPKEPTASQKPPEQQGTAKSG